MFTARSQKGLHLRPNIPLPIPIVLKVALPEMIRKQQCILRRRPDDIGGWPEKAADRDRQERLLARSAVRQEAPLHDRTEDRLAIQGTEVPHLQLSCEFVVSEI